MVKRVRARPDVLIGLLSRSDKPARPLGSYAFFETVDGFGIAATASATKAAKSLLSGGNRQQIPCAAVDHLARSRADQQCLTE
jgi:hypothetical protein